jgi:hypothetical protein
VTTVRFTAESLGAILHEEATAFVGSVAKGATGELVGPHPSPRLPDWLLVKVAVADVVPGNEGCRELLEELEKTELFVPVHPSQIEEV